MTQENTVSVKTLLLEFIETFKETVSSTGKKRSVSIDLNVENSHEIDAYATMNDDGSYSIVITNMFLDLILDDIFGTTNFEKFTLHIIQKYEYSCDQNDIKTYMAIIYTAFIVSHEIGHILLGHTNYFKNKHNFTYSIRATSRSSTAFIDARNITEYYADIYAGALMRKIMPYLKVTNIRELIDERKPSLFLGSLFALFLKIDQLAGKDASGVSHYPPVLARITAAIRGFCGETSIYSKEEMQEFYSDIMSCFECDNVMSSDAEVENWFAFLEEKKHIVEEFKRFSFCEL